MSHGASYHYNLVPCSSSIRTKSVVSLSIPNSASSFSWSGQGCQCQYPELWRVWQWRSAFPTFRRDLFISVTIGSDFPPGKPPDIWYRAVRCWRSSVCSWLIWLIKFAISSSNSGDAYSWHFGLGSLSPGLSNLCCRHIALLFVLVLVSAWRLCLVLVGSHCRTV